MRTDITDLDKSLWGKKDELFADARVFGPSLFHKMVGSFLPSWYPLVTEKGPSFGLVPGIDAIPHV